MQKRTFKNIILLLFLTLLAISCSRGDPTVSDSSISPYSPQEELFTYWEKIDPNIKFISKITLSLDKYYSNNGYTKSFYGSAFFYKESDQIPFTVIPETNKCNQYTTIEEYGEASGNDGEEELDQILIGSMNLTGENYIITMDQIDVSVFPGLVSVGNYTLDKEEQTIYLDGNDFSGFGIGYSLTTDNGDCLENGCLRNLSITNAIYFPKDFILTPNAGTFSSDENGEMVVSSLSDLKFEWENNNDISDTYDSKKVVYLQLDLIDNDQNFSSFTECTIPDQGIFDPSLSDSSFKEYMETLLLDENIPSTGTLSIKRLSQQIQELEDGSKIFIEISINEAIDVAF